MKIYLFRGQRIKATSKDEILRRFGLKNNTKTLALIVKIKKMENTK